MQIFIYRFVQLLLFKYMYTGGFKIYSIMIDNQRTLFQLAQLIAVFLVQLSMFSLLLKKVYFKKYLAWLKNWRQKLSPALGVLIVLIPISLYVIYFNMFTGQFNEFAEQTLFLYAAFFFMGALSEELLFRGYFYRILVNRNKKYAIYLIMFQALIFTLVHFNNPGHSITRIAILFIAGLLLGIIALKGFMYAVLFHFFWNFFQAYLLGLNVSGYQFIGSLCSYPAAAAWENNIYTGMLLAVITAIILAMYYHRRKLFV